MPLQLVSTVTPDGNLELSLAEVPVPEPGENELLIRVEAAPINPSDLGGLLAGADMAAAQAAEIGGRPGLRAPLPEAAAAMAAPRVGKPVRVGNEGAGEVVAAGAGAESLLGRTVATLGGRMYAQYRVAPADQVLALHEGTTAEQGASCFVNPLTVLGMVETMRLEGHTALVHTAAASNLGQMLQKVCSAEGIGLVNVVRRPAHVELLKGIGATHVVDSSEPSFRADLTAALAETGATLGFDATGGGNLAGTILACMEAALARKGGAGTAYGTATHKQVYIYGGLDRSPSTFQRAFGMAWGMGGWLLPLFLARIGNEAADRLRQRVADEITTTFASGYSNVVSLAGALDPDAARDYARQATGQKYLIAPQQED